MQNVDVICHRHPMDRRPSQATRPSMRDKTEVEHIRLVSHSGSVRLQEGFERASCGRNEFGRFSDVSCDQIIQKFAHSTRVLVPLAVQTSFQRQNQRRITQNHFCAFDVFRVVRFWWCLGSNSILGDPKLIPNGYRIELLLDPAVLVRDPARVRGVS